MYDPALAERLCLAIATSTKGLRAICSKPGFPSRTTVYKWLAEIPDFANRYARAKEFQAQILFDQIIDIADRPKLGAIVKTDSTGKRERRVGDIMRTRRVPDRRSENGHWRSCYRSGMATASKWIRGKRSVARVDRRNERAVEANWPTRR